MDGNEAKIAEVAKPETPVKKKKKGLVIALVAVLVAALAIVLAVTVIIPKSRYNAAIALKDLGRYEEAIAAFEALGGYKDSATEIEACKIGVKDNAYADALALMDAGQYEEAIAAFTAMDGYKDSIALIAKCEFKNTKVGDIIVFGSYEQDNNTENGKEEIEWIVLDKEDSKILVISKYALDEKPYHDKYEGCTWESCSLRSWLNGEFYKAAFSTAEQAVIVETTVNADKNAVYSSVNSGKNTEDKVFLLSITEVNKYFTTEKERICEETAYSSWSGNTQENAWWLRSPGYSNMRGAYVNWDGAVECYGSSAILGFLSVRPAMWIDLAG